MPHCRLPRAQRGQHIGDRPQIKVLPQKERFNETERIQLLVFPHEIVAQQRP